MSVDSIKRTLWEAACEPCEFRKTYDKNPPREVQCSGCSKWLQPKELSYTGPGLEQKNSPLQMMTSARLR